MKYLINTCISILAVLATTVIFIILHFTHTACTGTRTLLTHTGTNSMSQSILIFLNDHRIEILVTFILNCIVE